ncbi:MAG: hypothetical protein ACK4R2_09565 [Roseateles sp.]
MTTSSGDSSINPPERDFALGRSALEKLVEPDSLDDAFRFHEVRQDGVWLKPFQAQPAELRAFYYDAEFQVLTWTPCGDHCPALPFPFSARQLAAFLVWGQGSDVVERWSRGDVEERIAGDGARVHPVFLMLRAAHDLLDQASSHFPERLADGRAVDEEAVANDRADWLLQGERQGTSLLLKRRANTAGIEEAVALADMPSIASANAHEGAPLQRREQPQVTDAATTADSREKLGGPTPAMMDSGAVPGAPVPLTRFAAQEQTILSQLASLGYDPKRLPNVKAGTPTAKRSCWEAVRDNRKVFRSRKVFDKAWARLRRDGEVGNSPLPHVGVGGRVVGEA